jgi:hypothetical protein
MREFWTWLITLAVAAFVYYGLRDSWRALKGVGKCG